jgi:predicted ATPase
MVSQRCGGFLVDLTLGHTEMLKSIRIQNFRGLKSAEVKRLKRLNLVTGRNGGGKTSFLEAAFLNCGAANAALLVAIANFRGDKVIYPQSDRLLRSVFANLDESRHIQIYADELRQARTKGRSLVIEAKTKERSTPSGGGRELFISGVRLRFNGPSGQFVSELDINLPTIVPGTAPSIENPIKITDKGNPDIIFSQFVSPYFRDVEKEVHDQLTEAVKGKAIQNILEMVSIVQRGVTNVVPVTEWGQPNVYVDVGLKKLLPVTVLGSGFFHVLKIALAINAIQKGVIIIDELEDGIHYSIFPKVAELIVQALNNKNRQFFIATHSGELLKVLIETAAQKRFDDLCLINMTGAQDGGISTRQFDVDELQYAMDLEAELR